MNKILIPLWFVFALTCGMFAWYQLQYVHYIVAVVLPIGYPSYAANTIAWFDVGWLSLMSFLAGGFAVAFVSRLWRAWRYGKSEKAKSKT